MEIHTVPNFNFKLDGGAMFGIVPKVLWQKQYPADENNLVNVATRSLLVIDGDRKILFDTGIGDKQDPKFLGYYFLNGEDSLETSLSRLGLEMKDITDVFHTHFHFDHCGGSIIQTKDGKLVTAFSNATYWVSEEQWHWANNPNKLEAASFLPENILPMKESGQLEFYKHEQELTPNVQVRLYDGHTQGQGIVFMHYGGRMLVNSSDLIPGTPNISMSWVSGYDTRPLISLQEKEAFLKEAFENEYTLFFYHDLYTECCNLEMTKKGIRAGKKFKLKEFVQ